MTTKTAALPFYAQGFLPEGYDLAEMARETLEAAIYAEKEAEETLRAFVADLNNITDHPAALAHLRVCLINARAMRSRVEHGKEYPCPGCGGGKHGGPCGGGRHEI